MAESNNKQDNFRKAIGKWFLSPSVWRIPVYQRHYAWETDKSSDDFGPINLFWDTVKKQTNKRIEQPGVKIPQYYLGAVLVDQKLEQSATPTDPKIYDVVDGQQRLTTIQIAMLALINVANKYDYGDEAKEKLKGHIFSDFDQKKTKLDPTNFDRPQFQRILFDVYGILPGAGEESNMSNENAKKSKIKATFDFFELRFNNLVENYQQSSDLDKVINALIDTLTEGLDIFLIVLKETDDAQRVFESLNSYGKELSTFDLIRNHVFERADKRANELFTGSIWKKLEDPYWELEAEKGQKQQIIPHIDSYIARMLIAKKRESIRISRNDIFKSYKEFSKKCSSIDEEIEELASYMKAYQYLDGETEINPILSNDPKSPKVNFGIFRYNESKSRIFYPVIFLIIDSDVSPQEKQKMIKLVESYIVRRGVCDLTNKGYNNHVAAICKELGNKPYYEKVENLIKRFKTSENDSTIFPDDNMILSKCIHANFYKCAFRRYVLEQTTILKNDEVDIKKGLTTDHILPQKWEKDKDWVNMVLVTDNTGNKLDSETINKFYLNTIGNLTLLSREKNSAKSNKAFTFNKVKELLKNSGLKLNRDLAEKNVWNVNEIKTRSEILGKEICRIWPDEIS